MSAENSELQQKKSKFSGKLNQQFHILDRFCKLIDKTTLADMK